MSTFSRTARSVSMPPAPCIGPRSSEITAANAIGRSGPCPSPGITTGSCHFLLISQPRRQELQDFPVMTPEQPLHIQHTRTLLRPIPWRRTPPVHAPRGVQAELQQPQKAHRHPLRLAGPLDRVLRPRPAFLPPEALFEVPE